MKIHIYPTLLLFTLSIFISGTSLKAQAKFSKEEILNTPKGIINASENPKYWEDNNNLILSIIKPKGYYEYIKYNVKKGTKEVIKITPPKRSTDILTKVKSIKDYKNIRNYTFSPDSLHVAYTREDNNLYLYNTSSGKEKQLTTDGNAVILNGWASWIYYEEILGRSSKYKAFWWSPDSKTLAYYKFDDTKVPMFPIYHSEGVHGNLLETHYPKAGDTNPTVKIGFINISDIESKDSEEISKSTVWAQFNSEEDQYFGIPFWNGSGDRFIVPWMPRDQNNLILYTVNPLDGSKEKIYNEMQKTWIDWPEQMVFTKEGFYMIRDFDMWEQIYFQSFDGKRLEKITDGTNWGISIIKVDEKEGNIYFSARRDISTRNDFYRVNLKTKKIQKLSNGPYNFTEILLSPDNKHFTAFISNSSTPIKTVLFKIGKKDYTIIHDTKGENFDKYKIAIPEMLYITVDGYKLPAQVIWPIDMDTTKKYPVLVSIYGGPNAGTVMDRWKGVKSNTQWWANEGVIQIAIDHRASGHAGKEGVNAMYRKFVTVELSDYIAWMKELYKRPYVNREKVGITGFSYGGTVTAAAVIRYGEYFPFGIAGGGVYSYNLYDTHYTERYMDHPNDNKEGYLNTRIMDSLSKYKGDKTNYLKLTHGTNDDNVHMQNTLQLINALQNAGKQFDLMIYPGQYHGYRGLKSRHSNESDYIFWYKHLLDKEAPSILLK
jgi:Dipeptidyl aminopeptidases/acylaminoacyl-peptidases